MSEILYQDREILLCVKPVGVSSERGTEGTDLISCLERELGGYIGSVHRLDLTTGGVMLFARTPAAVGKLSEQIRDRSVQKEYLAVVDGVPEQAEGVLEDLLFHDRTRNKVFVVDRPRRGTKQASLSYRVLESVSTEKGAKTLLRICLHTGRTHQIRVQFSSRRLPLTGDGKYGSRDNGCTPALHSYRLALTHPVTGRPVEATSLPPLTEYPWRLFRETLEEL